MKANPNLPTKVTEQVIVSLPMCSKDAFELDWQVLRGPNKGLCRPMGKLLEDRILDLGDLGWIVEHAFDSKAKAAALTLLGYRLGEPQTTEAALRFGPEVINGSKYLEDQQWDSEMQAVVYLSVGITTALAIILEILWRAAEKVMGGNSWLVTLIALMIALPALLIPLGVYVWWQIRTQIDKARAFRLGREGEEWISDRMRALLDNRWVAFHNITLPKHRGDIDFVLVGPSGVWAFEVKAFGKDVRVHNRTWEWQTRKGWSRLGSDPVAQVRSNAIDLRYFIERHGVVLRVNAAVILTQPQRVTNFEPTLEPIWKQFEVDDKLSELNKLPECLPEKDRARIVSAIKETLSK